MRYLIVAVSMCVVATQSRADDKIDVAKAVEQAKSVAKAVLDEDYAKVAELTHPKVVEIMGGKEKMVEQTKTIMKTLKDMGIAIKSHNVGKPGEPVIDGKSTYLIIPTTMELSANGMKIVTESYLLGLSTDSGKSWVFVDGAGMDQKKVKDEVFPKLPDGLTLPKKKPPVVTKE